MKPEPEHIDQIKETFGWMQSREDLLDLLNQAKVFVYGEKAVPFKLNQITWYAHPALGGARYKEFKIKKKSGSYRSIHAPVKGLKALQRTMAFVLQCVYEPHKAAMGFVRGRSVVDNANLHVGRNYVYNIDLKDFFQSIDQARVWKCLQLRPFNLVDAHSDEGDTEATESNGFRVIEIGFHPKSQNAAVIKFANGLMALASIKKAFTREGRNFVPLFLDDDGNITEDWEIRKTRSSNSARWILPKRKDSAITRPADSRRKLADLIAGICCSEMEVERMNEAGEWEKVKRRVLPQGAPTSPVLTNIVCQRLDYLLTGVAKRFGLTYSRYADDITFSSMHNVYQPGSDFLKELHRIIAEQHFHIKESKTRLQKDGYRKEVTGLLVHEKANVQQRYIKQLRMWLYYWERYGYERASNFFLKQYVSNKGHIIKDIPDMVDVVAGKLQYLRMVKGGDNKLYLKLKSRLISLVGASKTSENRQSQLIKVLDILFEEGIDDAMDYYKSINS